MRREWTAHQVCNADAPQHMAVPSALRPHVCWPCVAMDANVCPDAAATGVNLSVVVPSPSTPELGSSGGISALQAALNAAAPSLQRPSSRHQAQRPGELHWRRLRERQRRRRSCRPTIFIVACAQGVCSGA